MPILHLQLNGTGKAPDGSDIQIPPGFIMMQRSAVPRQRGAEALGRSAKNPQNTGRPSFGTVRDAVNLPASDIAAIADDAPILR